MALFVVNGQVWSRAASGSQRGAKPVVSSDARTLRHEKSENLHSNMGVVVMQSLVLEGNSSSPLPASRSRSTSSETSSKPASRYPTPLTPPTPATVSKQTVTVTVPTIPSAATATASPGGKDLSKVINLLFAILLVVTAILMVITGVCVFDLRRRYQDVSQPCYNQLKSAPI